MKNLNFLSFDDVGVMGDGGEGRHRGRGLHAGPWPLPSVTCIEVMAVPMVPGESWPI